MAKLEHYIQIGQKRLRCGYTTGTCAAAAVCGAAELFFTGEAPSSVLIKTPAGIMVKADIEAPSMKDGVASCAVRKDGGDDPDITDGMLIFAAVRLIEKKTILIDGGEGVGRVTRPGLDQPVGSAAINSTPRKMISQQLQKAAEKHQYSGGFSVVISVPEGRALAEKTFNPRLGIEGGLSILGTSGIVRPMSEEALMDSIHKELDVYHAEGTADLLMSPGNYGTDFCQSVLGLDITKAVQCSNYIGDTLDYAVSLGIHSILLVGHIGKLVKCAAGVMNTHSRVADCRMEVIAAHAAINGGGRELIKQLLASVTTDAAVSLLKEAGILSATMKDITKAAAAHLRRRAGEQVQIELLIFSNRYGVLGKTEGAEELLHLHRREC